MNPILFLVTMLSVAIATKGKTPLSDVDALCNKICNASYDKGFFKGCSCGVEKKTTTAKQKRSKVIVGRVINEEGECSYLCNSSPTDAWLRGCHCPFGRRKLDEDSRSKVIVGRVINEEGECSYLCNSSPTDAWLRGCHCPFGRRKLDEDSRKCNDLCEFRPIAARLRGCDCLHGRSMVDISHLIDPRGINSEGLCYNLCKSDSNKAKEKSCDCFAKRSTNYEGRLRKKVVERSIHTYETLCEYVCLSVPKYAKLHKCPCPPQVTQVVKGPPAAEKKTP